MKRLLCIPLILSFGMMWGCGSSDVDSQFDRSSLNEQCDYLLATVHNSDELLQCEVAMTACTDQEMFMLVEKWSCDLGEMTDEPCPLDENGDIMDYEVQTTPECKEAQADVLPEDNSLLAFLQSVWAGKLAGTNWCGPGDKTHETKGVTSTIDASCRRHDHGHGYGEQPWYLGWMPKAYCTVDGDIVNGANGAGVDGSIAAHQADFARSAINTVFGYGTYYYCQSYKNVRNCSWSCGWGGCSRSCSTSYQHVDLWGGDKSWHMDHGHDPGYADGCTHNNMNQNCH